MCVHERGRVQTQSNREHCLVERQFACFDMVSPQSLILRCSEIKGELASRGCDVISLAWMEKCALSAVLASLQRGSHGVSRLGFQALLAQCSPSQCTESPSCAVVISNYAFMCNAPPSCVPV